MKVGLHVFDSFSAAMSIVDGKIGLGGCVTEGVNDAVSVLHGAAVSCVHLLAESNVLDRSVGLARQRSESRHNDVTDTVAYTARHCHHHGGSKNEFVVVLGDETR